MFQEQKEGLLTAKEFCVMLKKMGVLLNLEDTTVLIKVIDRKSDGQLLHFTELL
jgi:Ca2+-binding EF-hand superfamily protein